MKRVEVGSEYQLLPIYHAAGTRLAALWHFVYSFQQLCFISSCYLLLIEEHADICQTLSASLEVTQVR